MAFKLGMRRFWSHRRIGPVFLYNRLEQCGMKPCTALGIGISMNSFSRFVQSFSVMHKTGHCRAQNSLAKLQTCLEVSLATESSFSCWLTGG